MGNKDEYPLDLISSSVLKIAKELGFDNEKIVFWGSSGGGFASLLLASKVNHSLAVAINPQTYIPNYYKNHVQDCIDICFSGNITDVKENYKERIDIAHEANRKKCRALILQNINDKFHYENHFLPLKRKVKNNEFNFLTYDSESGHGPEKKEMIEGIVKEVNKINSKYINIDHSLSSPSDILKTIKNLYNKELFEDCYEQAMSALKRYPNGYNFARYAAYACLKVKNNEKALELLLKVQSQLKEKTPSDVKEKIEKIKNAKSNVRNKEFRYGFLLLQKGDESLNLDDLNDWNKYATSEYYIYTHPETKLRIKQHPTSTTIIIGDIFSTHKEKSVEECLDHTTKDNNWNYLDYLSGRFSIINIKKEGSFILNDPFGSRTIFYSLKKCVLSSHAALVAKVTNEEKDPLALKFISSPEYKERGTTYLPGDSTIYKNIKGLAPNNLLKLKEQKTERYWPRDFNSPKKVDDFLDEADEYFLHFSAFLNDNGYKPVLGLTAGVDSRAVIAGLMNKDTKCHLITWTRLPENEKPIVEEMIKYLGCKHQYINTKTKLKDKDDIDIAKISSSNSGFYRGPSSLTGQMYRDMKDPDHIFIRGLGGEICRGFYNRHNSKLSEKTLPESLSKLYLTKKIKNPSKDFYEFVLNSFDGFVKRANYTQDIFNYDVLDLFYWEQRMGMWAANLLNEMDPAMYDFVGLNSRRLYQIAMGIEKEERLGSSLLIKITEMYDIKLSKILVES